MAYQFESRVRFSEVDETGKLSLASIIDYFQDCSTFQSEECGNGIAALIEKNVAWMILSWQVQIFRRPALGEHIIVRTWPYAFKAFYGHRNYDLITEQGECLARANAIWALINIENGHPIRVLQEFVSRYPLEPPFEDFPEMPRKIRMPKESIQEEAFSVTRSQIDTNHHVNNGQYIHMAEAYLPEGFETGFLRVEYRQQARLENQIFPLIHTEDDTITVSLCDTQNKPYSILVFSKTQEPHQK